MRQRNNLLGRRWLTSKQTVRQMRAVLRRQCGYFLIDGELAKRAAQLVGATRAQGMIEYALLAGFVAIVGALTMMTAPTTTENVRKLLNKLGKYLALAAGASAQTFC